MEEVGRRARVAARELAAASIESRNTALRAMHTVLQASVSDIVTANKRDLATALESRLDPAVTKVRQGVAVEACARLCYLVL